MRDRDDEQREPEPESEEDSDSKASDDEPDDEPTDDDAEEFDDEEEESDDEESDDEDSDDEESDDEESVPLTAVGIAKRMLAMLVVAGFVWMLLMAMVASKARKEIGRGLTVMSRDLVQQYEMMADKENAQEGPRVLVLNGQRMTIETGFRNTDVSGVMDSMSGDCERIDEGDESYQTCVAGGLSERLQRLARGDHDISGFHYRYAASKDEGAFFVDLKPNADFDVDGLFNSDGDVEGPEHADIPRPPDGRRLISAYEEGKPYLASFFVNSSTPRELQSYYRQNMDPGIWAETELSDSPEEFMVFRRRGAPDRFVALTFKPRSRGDGTVTVITEAQ